MLVTSHPLHYIHGYLLEVFEDEHLTVTNGTAGQGDTLESRLGILRNNSKDADFDGMELKTIASGKGDFRPLTLAGGYERLLQERWPSFARKDGKRCFTLGFRCGQEKVIRRGTAAETVTEMRLDSDALRRIFGRDQEVGTWTRGEVEQRLTKKMSDMLIVQARKSQRGEQTYYRYHDYTYYGGLSVEKFFDAISAGKVQVEFRVRGDEDKGTCFRMKTRDLALIYDTVMTRTDYEVMHGHRAA